MADNTAHTLHNVYALRGTPVRNAAKWADHLSETIALYGSSAEVALQGHHWPVWGTERIIAHLKSQRDLYKFTHDQSVRLLNAGCTGEEIAEALDAPPALGNAWANRGYYGTLKHNARGIYQHYMGWYDGNPANLDPVPQEASARKYVTYMGGAAAVLARAQEDFRQGQYRWVAEAVKHVVFADPRNRDARYLFADALEQLAYQAESASWRSAYLQGARELRDGVSDADGADQTRASLIKAMAPEQIFDVLAVQLNGERAAGKSLTLLVSFPDLDLHYALKVENGVMTYAPATGQKADAKLTVAKSTLEKIQLGQLSDTGAFITGKMHLKGRRSAYREFFDLFDRKPAAFNIVTP
jgi:alkyl sulfatase BDS1-like metallo-beta-lactamase superfamily hydrolase